MIDDLEFLKKKFMNKGLSLIDLFEITFCSHRNKNICSVVLFHTVIRYIYFMEKQKKSVTMFSPNFVKKNSYI